MTDHSLAFQALDAHIISGRADDPAFVDDAGPLSYAQLLHESAVIAGSMAQLGIEPGRHVVLDGLDRRHQVVAVLAVARLGAVPAVDGDVRLTGRPPTLAIDDQDPIAWDVLVNAGRVDPWPAPASDPDGYAQVLRGADPEVFSTLVDGGTISA